MELQSSKHHGNRKHGGFGTRLYRIWIGMKDRCFNKNGSNYYAYGAKGIVVCDEWKNSFEAFRSWALENGYEDTLTLDREDNDKGYYPDNCRWATSKEQLLNRRPSKPNGNFVCENQPYLKYCFTKQIICPICECSLWQLIYSNNGNRTKLFKYKCKKCKAVLKTRKEFKKWN